MQPSHGQGVHYTDPQTVVNAVTCLTVSSRAVIYRYLGNSSITRNPEQGGQEAMESLKRGDMLYALVAKYSQGTSHIRDVFMSQPVSKTIRDA